MIKIKNSLDDFNQYKFDRRSFPNTYNFLESQTIINVEPIKSRWRANNLVLKTSCSFEEYVVKKINESDPSGEIDQAILIRKTYPELTPTIFLTENRDCYTLKYVRAKSFFNLEKDEKIEKINLAGKLLNQAHNSIISNNKDVSKEVKKNFEYYRDTRKEFFKDDELRLNEETFEIFKNVPDKPSHNDLNAENILYNCKIYLIDPSNEGYNDIARDVGRYCASCFFNNFDYFGQDKKHSLKIAESFLKNFDKDMIERVRYYMGESFLSFIKYKTCSTEKSVLKNLAIKMLTKKGDILETLEEAL